MRVFACVFAVAVIGSLFLPEFDSITSRLEQNAGRLAIVGLGVLGAYRLLAGEFKKDEGDDRRRPT